MRPKVALCICTCRRPAGLRKALLAVERIDFEGDLHVIVVENHYVLEGQAVVEALREAFRWPLACVVAEQRGISHARNAGANAALALGVDFIAMIDDDEWPDPDWLSLLLATQAAGDYDYVAQVKFSPDVPTAEVMRCPTS